MLENGFKTNAENVQQMHSVEFIRIKQGFPEGFFRFVTPNKIKGQSKASDWTIPTGWK